MVRFYSGLRLPCKSIDSYSSLLHHPLNLGISHHTQNGDINLLNPNDASAPKSALHGHQVTVTALAVLPENGTFFTGSYDGAVMGWSKKGVATR